MNLSHAMAVAAAGLAVKKDQLRSIAQTLESEPRAHRKRARHAASSETAAHDARWRQESVLALQASRRLLARTIDMLT